MDPITQGILGATASQVVVKPKEFKARIILVTVMGFISGLMADADVFIKSPTDPLLFLEYHRHFTHSIFFIPIGGFIAACLFYVLLYKWRVLSFKEIWFYCTAAYATHGLIDACTSYGTLLLWPLSGDRIAWSNMPIIDPLYTLPIIVLVITAAISKKKKWAFVACFWALFYPLLGVVQGERVKSVASGLAEQRGHENIKGLTVKPSIGNLILWKSIYEYENRFYVDAVRMTTKAKVYEGDSIAKLQDYKNLNVHFPWLNLESRQAKDIERFRWFAQGYVAQSVLHENQVMDVRYSALPNQILPLWSIELDEQAGHEEYAEYIVDEDNRKKLWADFVEMLKGN